MKVGGEFRNSEITNGGTFNGGRGKVTFATLQSFLAERLPATVRS